MAGVLLAPHTQTHTLSCAHKSICDSSSCKINKKKEKFQEKFSHRHYSIEVENMWMIAVREWKRQREREREQQIASADTGM